MRVLMKIREFDEMEDFEVFERITKIRNRPENANKDNAVKKKKREWVRRDKESEIFDDREKAN